MFTDKYEIIINERINCCGREASSLLLGSYTELLFKAYIPNKNTSIYFNVGLNKCDEIFYIELVDIERIHEDKLLTVNEIAELYRYSNYMGDTYIKNSRDNTDLQTMDIGETVNLKLSDYTTLEVELLTVRLMVLNW